MSVKQRKNVSYGLNQPLLGVSPAPIVSQRAPTNTDKAEIGSIWIDQPNDDSYILTSINANVATWIGMGGGPGLFHDLTVEGSSTLEGPVVAEAGLTVSQGNVAVDLGSLAVGGNITAGLEITAAGDITSNSGDITAHEGNVVISDDDYGVVFSTGTTIFAGAGSPHGLVEAKIGSLWLNTTAGNAGERAFINTDDGTTWTAITTAA